jgi:hypothetical protein
MLPRRRSIHGERRGRLLTPIRLQPAVGGHRDQVGCRSGSLQAVPPVNAGFSGATSRFQTLTDPSVQFVGASATADPCFQAWIVRQSNRLVRNRHVIDKFVPQQSVSLAKHAVSVVKHIVTVVRHTVTTSPTHRSQGRDLKSPVSHSKR